MEEDAERAAETRHSTAAQAAELAAAASVRMLALTHISPRYSGGQVREEARAIFENTIVPRDFDTVEIPFPERGEPLHVMGLRRSAEESDGASARSGSHTPTGSAPAGREP
jgi:predicted RNA-binding Zn ribbon-like protein